MRFTPSALVLLLAATTAAAYRRVAGGELSAGGEVVPAPGSHSAW